MSPGCLSLIINGPIISEWTAPLLTWLNDSFTLLVIFQGYFAPYSKWGIKAVLDCGLVTWIKFHFTGIATCTLESNVWDRVVVRSASLGARKSGRYFVGNRRTLLSVVTGFVMFLIFQAYFIPHIKKRSYISLYFKCLWNTSFIYIFLHSTAICVRFSTKPLGF